MGRGGFGLRTGDSLMNKEKVELLPSLFWICPECGEDNFVRVIREEMSEEDESKMLEDIDDPDAVSAESYLYPLEVECSNCNEEFEVEKFQCDECEDCEEGENTI